MEERIQGVRHFKESKCQKESKMYYKERKISQGKPEEGELDLIGSFLDFVINSDAGFGQLGKARSN